jgi:hypothetical protein
VRLTPSATPWEGRDRKADEPHRDAKSPHHHSKSSHEAILAPMRLSGAPSSLISEEFVAPRAHVVHEPIDVVRGNLARVVAGAMAAMVEEDALVLLRERFDEAPLRAKGRSRSPSRGARAAAARRPRGRNAAGSRRAQ